MENLLEYAGRPAAGSFMDFVRGVRTGRGALSIFWLGQAGFLFKTPGGRLVAVDPYLSDCCERIAGFRRITPPALPVSEFEADELFCSHEHPDHFDADLISGWKDRSEARVFGPAPCAALAREAGLPEARFVHLREGYAVDLGEYSVLPVKADHGALSPDALGFVFDFGFVRVYFSGDTAYSPGALRHALERRAEIALLPVNGEFGNLDARDALRLARDAGAGALIPCHYWTFVEHGSNPLELLRAADGLRGIQLVFLPIGGCCVFRADAGA